MFRHQPYSVQRRHSYERHKKSKYKHEKIYKTIQVNHLTWNAAATNFVIFFNEEWHLFEKLGQY